MQVRPQTSQKVSSSESAVVTLRASTPDSRGGNSSQIASLPLSGSLLRPLPSPGAGPPIRNIFCADIVPYDFFDYHRRCRRRPGDSSSTGARSTTSAVSSPAIHSSANVCEIGVGSKGIGPERCDAQMAYCRSQAISSWEQSVDDMLRLSRERAALHEAARAAAAVSSPVESYDRFISGVSRGAAKQRQSWAAIKQAAKSEEASRFEERKAAVRRQWSDTKRSERRMEKWRQDYRESAITRHEHDLVVLASTVQLTEEGMGNLLHDTQAAAGGSPGDRRRQQHHYEEPPLSYQVFSPPHPPLRAGCIPFGGSSRRSSPTSSPSPARDAKASLVSRMRRRREEDEARLKQAQLEMLQLKHEEAEGWRQALEDGVTTAKEELQESVSRQRAEALRNKALHEKLLDVRSPRWRLKQRQANKQRD